MRKDDPAGILEFNVSLDTREIFFVSEELTTSDVLEFIKNVRILDRKPGPIIIHQYCLGGEHELGMAIYDAILTAESPFIFLSYGCAASMGSIIPQAVHKTGYRISMPNCNWLIHEGYISIENNKKAVHSYVEASSKFINKMYDIYSSVCSGSNYFKDEKQSKIKSYLKRKLSSREDWWLTAQEAVDYGFADAILGSPGYENLQKIKSYFQ